MSEKYIPLYRKYRPKNLQEVVGQDHIKKALENAINLNRISHAYLFTGPRGTGKTSIARILAKSLNCKEGPTLTPCEECPSCIDVKNSTLIDVIEIDAASNRKVEDAQNILEKIQYVPVNGRYKIYIIDEVHMLTNHAFNALLKTLEEPPENVIFILATTEPQKVLETITSRCQRFDFRRITTDDIINHLKYVAKSEKIKIDDDALFTIAKNSAGGMRDSLALLDQVSVLSNSKSITSDDVNKLLGRISFDTLNKLCDNIIQSKPQDAIELLEQIYNSGNEPSQILTNLLGYLKNLLIVKNCQGDNLLINLTQLNNLQIKALKIQSEHIETHQITFLIEKVIYYIKELKTTTNQYLWLEVAIIDMTNLAQNTSLLQLQERISNLENNTVKQVMQPVYVAKPANKETENRECLTEEANGKQQIVNSEVMDKEVNTQRDAEEEKSFTSITSKELPMPVSKPVIKKDNNISTLWIELMKNISSTPTVSLLNQHAKPIEISEEKIVIGCKENFLKLLSSESKRSAIEEGAKKIFNKAVNVIIKTADATDFSAIEKKNVIEDAKKPGSLEALQNKNQTSDLPNFQTSKNNASMHPNISTTAEPSLLQESSDEIDDEIDFIEHKLAKKTEKFVPSDQVSMVINLFDGKYIE